MAGPRHLFAPGSPLLPRRGSGTRARILWTVLLAFVLRAMIPIGFMPAVDGTLSLKICAEGFPAALPDAAAHGPATASGAGHHVREDHCPFCGASTPAPGPLFVALACVVWVVIGTVALAPSSGSLISPLHLPQARAPPAAP